MIFYGIHSKIQKHFDENLKDWYAGGPKKDGWTRTGPKITKNLTIKLTNYNFIQIPVEEALAKNREESQKWHISFLNNNPDFYIEEYLMPRHRNDEKTKYFQNLFQSIKETGLKRRIYIADVKELDLGFRYFRFDGCHRLCIFKVLGYTHIPAICFKTALEPFYF